MSVAGIVCWTMGCLQNLCGHCELESGFLNKSSFVSRHAPRCSRPLAGLMKSITNFLSLCTGRRGDVTTPVDGKKKCLEKTQRFAAFYRVLYSGWDECVINVCGVVVPSIIVCDAKCSGEQRMGFV